MIKGLSQEQIQELLPPDLFKKFRLLRRFKREFKYRIVRDRVPNYFLQFEKGVNLRSKVEQTPEETKAMGPSEMVFVEKLQKIKEKAVLIWLSNGTIQVNFPECCILIQNEANNKVMNTLHQRPPLQNRFSDLNSSPRATQRIMNSENPAFLIAIFSRNSPQEPRLYNYVPNGADNLDTLPKEAMLAISVLHEASALAITRQKKRHLSPDTATKQKNMLGQQLNGSGSKKKAPQSPSLRHLKDTKLAL